MRTRHLIVGIVMLGLIVWPGCGRSGAGTDTGKTPAEASASSVLGVDEYMRNVDQYVGTVTVEGVVNGVVPGEKMLTLIDSGECQECPSANCARLTLPVRWEGDLPGVRSLVRAEGRAQQVEDKLIFVASAVHTLREDVEALP